MKPARAEVLGVPVDVVDMAQAVDAAEAMLAQGQARAVIAVNPEKVMKARQDPALLAQIRAAGLLIPDGIGVVLALRVLGLGRAERVPGSELMPALCQRAAEKGYGVFLYGGRPEVNEGAAAALLRRHPTLRLVGCQHGYLEQERMDELVDRINQSGAQFLFVALGSPQQELWMHRYLERLRTVRVCQGVGGTFDVLAGRVKRAPVWTRRIHMEWLYRLAAQPSRIRRHTALAAFTVAVLRQRLRGRG